MNLRKRNSLASNSLNLNKENIVNNNPSIDVEPPQLTKTQSLHEVLECQKPTFKPHIPHLLQIHPEMQYSQEILLNEINNKLYPEYDMQVEVDNKQITAEVRSTLISWLVDVHKNFKFRNETLHFCISLLDSFVSRSNQRKCDYQLVGLTALFIAGKYEQIETPVIRDFVAITDKLFEPYQILRAQGQILCTLNFKIVTSSTLFFIDYFNKYIHEKKNIIINKKYESLCYYLSEIVMVQHNYLKIHPICLALCIIAIINNMNKKSNYDPHSVINIIRQLINQYRFTIKDIQNNERMIQMVIKNRQNNKFKSVNKKYEKYYAQFNLILR